MTYADFRVLVAQYAKAGGTFAVDTDNADAMRSLINRGLRSFTEYTYSMPKFAEPLQLQVGMLEQFTGDIFEAVKVKVNGNTLRNQNGGKGPTSLRWLMDRYSDYETAPSGMPAHYVQLDNCRLLLYPRPAEAYESYITGFALHPEIIGEDGEEGTVHLSSRLEDLGARWVAMMGRNPHVQGSGKAGILSAIDKEVVDAAKIVRSRNLHMLSASESRFQRGKVLRF